MGQELERGYDRFGRLAFVRGPYDGAAPGLEMRYRPEASPPVAVTENRPSAPPGYAGPVPPPMTTVTAADGLGRAIEMRKSAVVGGALGMTTSGLVSRDPLGREVTAYHPFFTAGTSETFLPPEVTFATQRAYDPLDRTTEIVHPDGARRRTTYAIAPSPGGALLFLTREVDENCRWIRSRGSR